MMPAPIRKTGLALAAAASLLALGACSGQSASTPAPAADATPPPAAEAKPATILVVGASGMIGSRIALEAASRGHQVIGAARNTEKIPQNANIRAVKLDATDIPAFTELAKDADVIVSAVSPRGGGNPTEEATAIANADIAVAKATGKRLIVVGGAGSLNRPDGTPVVDGLPDRFKPEANAMRAVLDLLKASDVEWTFFSPANSIKPGERTGKFQIGTTTLLSDAEGNSNISAEDYAVAMVNEIEKPEHIRSQMTIAY